MRGAVALACLAVGCGTGPAFTSAGGVDVYLGARGSAYLDRKTVDELDGRAVRLLADAGGRRDELSSCLDELVAVVEDTDVLSCTVACSGYLWLPGRVRLDGTDLAIETGSPEIHIVDRGMCGRASPYLHELAHWLLKCSTGDEDAGHAKKSLWETIDADLWNADVCTAP